MSAPGHLVCPTSAPCSPSGSATAGTTNYVNVHLNLAGPGPVIGDASGGPATTNTVWTPVTAPTDAVAPAPGTGASSPTTGAHSVPVTYLTYRNGRSPPTAAG
jgi:hypothetical protein